MSFKKYEKQLVSLNIFLIYNRYLWHRGVAAWIIKIILKNFEKSKWVNIITRALKEYALNEHCDCLQIRLGQNIEKNSGWGLIFYFFSANFFCDVG